MIYEQNYFSAEDEDKFKRISEMKATEAEKKSLVMCHAMSTAIVS
jgi:hypothetical protein